MLYAGGCGLNGLSDAYLSTVSGDPRVQAHVLCLERSHFNPSVGQKATKPGYHEALSYVGGGS